MKRRLVLLMLLLMTSIRITAQDCGDGLPCGPIPWALPNYPVLITPTPILGDAAINTPTPTHTPTPTRTATLTPTDRLTATPFWDPEVLDNHIATAQSIIEATEVVVLDAEGTPVGESTAEVIFFEYAKGIATGETFGPFTALLATLMVGLGLSFLLAVMHFTLPIAWVILGLLLKIISFIIKAIRG